MKIKISKKERILVDAELSLFTADQFRKLLKKNLNIPIKLYHL